MTQLFQIFRSLICEIDQYSHETTMKYRTLPLLLLLSALMSCQMQTGQNTGTEEDLSRSNTAELYAKKTYTLPNELNEISGMTFLSNSQDIAYVVQDEEGIVFTYDLKNGNISSQFEFGPSGDYEEITTDGKYFYVLESNGDIHSFPISMDVDQGKVATFKGKLEKGEYESMAYDQKNNSLVVICKSCKTDRGNASLSGYVLNVLGQGDLSLKNQFSLDLNNIGNLDPKVKDTLKPSSLSKRNSSEEWYLLSSVDRLLLVLDENFQAKEIQHFKKKQLEQPEGISFNNLGQLFISSEKGKAENAFIYQINMK